jgi:hypothetical protein
VQVPCRDRLIVNPAISDPSDRNGVYLANTWVDAPLVVFSVWVDPPLVAGAEVP